MGDGHHNHSAVHLRRHPRHFPPIYAIILGMDALLQTKLRLPPLQPKLVTRPRLLDQLDGAGHCRLLLLCAPAGFGKSTLLTAWLHHTATPVAWLALDDYDDEPGRFWPYLLGALDRILPGLARDLTPLLGAAESGNSNALLIALVNRLADLSTPMILALDDYHYIHHQQIHAGIAFLLDHLPQPVQLVISSRSEPPLPLPRLRARNQLLELRSADLRFVHEESARFLRERMGLDLADAEVAQLDARTEGWVAGLQFSGLSLHKRPGGQPSPSRLTGLSANISGRDRHVVDYLLSEVLEQQPPAVQEFLLKTAILDRLSAGLCEALLVSDSGEALLAYVERANLFLVALDQERQWYRYHHLFAELLRDRLHRHYGRDEVCQLHSHARDWYQQHGMTEAALTHAFAMPDYPWAAAALEALVYNAGWQPNAFLALRTWIDRLPATVLQRYPRLALAGLEGSMLTFRSEGIERYLQILAVCPTRPADVTALLLSNQASLLRVEGRIAEAKTLLREAMAVAPEEDLYTQVSIREQMAVILFEHENIAAGIQLLRESADLARQMGRTFTALSTEALMGVFTIGHGQLRQAAQIFTHIIGQARQLGLTDAMVMGLPQIGLGIIAYYQNDLAAASHYCEQGLAHSEAAELGEALWQGYQVQVQMALRQGDEEAVDRLLVKVQQLVARTTTPSLVFTLRKYYDFFAADIALQRGNLVTVRHWVESQQLDLAELRLTEWYFYELVIQLYLASSRLPQPAPTVRVQLQKSVTALQTLIAFAARTGRYGTVLRLHLLLALTYQALGEMAAALPHLATALHQAEPEGYIRVFLDEGEPARTLLVVAQQHGIAPTYTAKLLTAFQAEPAFATPSTPTATPVHTAPLPGVQPLVEAITEREQEVLHLIAQGLTNQEIADRLIISVATVKRHISNLYGKLGVTHRTEALVKAQALALLPH